MQLSSILTRQHQQENNIFLLVALVLLIHNDDSQFIYLLISFIYHRRMVNYDFYDLMNDFKKFLKITYTTI